ncbi:MAG: hypothetical protein K2O07_06230 [Alistipes sp.]|nr:hypothetical protein [Alistipes sp.]
MRRFVCHMLLCCSLCLTVSEISAQVCWESLDGSRQRKTLASRSLDESVRRLYDAADDCDGQTVDEALSHMTVRCKDRYRAALYVCLYDRLHEQRGSGSATDALILQHHAEPLLVRLRDDDGGSMFRWAYALARHYAAHGGAEAFDADLQHALGRRAKRYTDICRSFGECVTMAIRSFETGGRVVLDITEPRRAATGFVEITRDDYAAETAATRSVSMPADMSPLSCAMRDELLWRDGICCQPFDSPWQGVECAVCSMGAVDCIVLTGCHGIGVTLSLPVEITSAGVLYSVERGGVSAAVISSDASVEQIGFASLPEGRLLQIKCNDEAVSVEIETVHGIRWYQWLPSK